jgi:hypothetical protein
MESPRATRVQNRIYLLPASRAGNDATLARAAADLEFYRFESARTHGKFTVELAECVVLLTPIKSISTDSECSN